jgi:CRISPR-associated protein Csm1
MLEGTLSFVPSSTNTKEIADISLYDHMKLTAAIANAIYEYAKEKEITDYKEKFFEKAEEFYEEEAFLLYSFDLSGIQDFIYTIVSSGAQQQLRSRSFYLEMIAEVAVDNLLRENSLTRANLLYSGGGHAYIILPNTEFARTAIEKVGQEMNEWLMETFGAKLYFAFGYTHFCANKVMQGNDPKEYSKIFRKVSKQISEKKLHRYDAETIEKLNRGGKKEGRECRVCRSIDNLPEVDEEETSICQMCKNLEKFSKDIQKEKYFELNEQFGLEVGKNQFLKVVSEKAIKAGEVKGKIYVKNQFATGESIGTHIWVADYASEKDIGEYAKMETVIRENEKLGIRRLAVLRCDVDNLGLGFMIGFSKQNGGKFQTLSRTATFSRVMSQFFKLYMNQFAKDYEVTIVYSGGDDVFAIGQWKSVIDFAIKLDDELKTFSNHKLSLSSGIGIFGGKTPVNILAHQTGELEESAKGVDNKNGIALFSSKFTYSYELFVEKIYNEKLPFIRNFFNNQNEKGKAFIYKLLSLIRERNEKERITFARLAYFLARLEDSMKKDDKKLFKEFKEQFKTWFDDKENAEQLECAIMLYIYETRKDGEHE